MPVLSNNAPVIIELTKEDAAFLDTTCEVNLTFILGHLQTVSEKTAVELVKHLEAYKRIREALKKGSL